MVLWAGPNWRRRGSNSKALWRRWWSTLFQENENLLLLLECLIMADNLGTKKNVLWDRVLCYASLQKITGQKSTELPLNILRMQTHGGRPGQTNHTGQTKLQSTQSKRPNSSSHKGQSTAVFYFFHYATAPREPGPLHYRGFTITLRYTTLGATPLDKWLARRRDLYLTTNNTHNRQTNMPPRGHCNRQSQQASRRRLAP